MFCRWKTILTGSLPSRRSWEATNTKIFSNSISSNRIARSVPENIEHGNYLLVKIEGKLFRGLIDTGSGTTLIKSSSAAKLNLPIRPVQKDEFSCPFAAEGSKLTADGIADVTFNIGGLLIVHSVYLVAIVAESLIIGSDFLSQNQIIIDYSNKVVSLCSDLVRAPLICNSERQHVARLTKTMCIPTGCEKIANINCSPRFSNRDVLVEAIPFCQFSQFAIARTLCRTDKQSNTVARILNCLPHTLVIPKGTKIATINNVDVAKDCKPFKTPLNRPDAKAGQSDLKISAEQLEEFTTDYGFKINPRSDTISTARITYVTV
jgi:hypothetical protein